MLFGQSVTPHHRILGEQPPALPVSIFGNSRLPSRHPAKPWGVPPV